VAIDHAQVNLVRVPDEMAFETAASLGCRFATAYRAVVHHGRVQAADWVVVHGCGGVGLSAVMIAASRGAQIIAVDISPTALELARTLGATVTLDPGHDPIVDAVRDLTGGGAAVSIDALGSIETCGNSIRSLRKRGRHVQVGLMLGADDAPCVPMSTVIASELEIVGSHGMAAHDYPIMLAEITAGRLSPQRLVQHRIGLSEAPAKLAALDQQPGNGITIINPTPLAP
jgi:alcohol dehydrogenase